MKVGRRTILWVGLLFAADPRAIVRCVPESSQGGAALTTELSTRAQAVPIAPVMTDDEIQRTWRVAEALAAGGQFTDVTKAHQAFARILLGRDLGLSPVESLMSLDVVEGNLQMRGVLLASFVRKSDKYDYDVLHSDVECCELLFHGVSKRVGEWVELGKSKFTIADARKQHLVKDSPKSAWNTVRRNMLFWRAMSNGVKMFCPDLLGGIPVYTEADGLGRVPNLAEGVGDGSEPGWQGVSIELAAEVEKVIRRAQQLGHASLSDRGSAQIALNHQPEERVQAWLEAARQELDTASVGPTLGASADPIEPYQGKSEAEWLRDEAAHAKENGDLELAADLTAQALKLENTNAQ